jgi:hypothetical protein
MTYVDRSYVFDHYEISNYLFFLRLKQKTNKQKDVYKMVAKTKSLIQVDEHERIDQSISLEQPTTQQKAIAYCCR